MWSCIQIHLSSDVFLRTFWGFWPDRLSTIVWCLVRLEEWPARGGEKYIRPYTAVGRREVFHIEHLDHTSLLVVIWHFNGSKIGKELSLFLAEAIATPEIWKLTKKGLKIKRTKKALTNSKVSLRAHSVQVFLI